MTDLPDWLVARCAQARYSAPDGPWAFTRAALEEFVRVVGAEDLLAAVAAEDNQQKLGDVVDA